LQTSEKPRTLSNQTLVNLKISMHALLACLIATILFSHCTKIKSTDLGTDLIPAADNVSTFDTTLSLETVNYLFGDSALPLLGKSLNGSVPEYMMGYISNDPQFGTSKGNMYFEMKPPGYKYFFENVKDSLALDSVVLCLKWNGTWGDTNAVQKIDVFELVDLLNPDSNYNTQAALRYRDLLGYRSFQPSLLNDSLYLFREKLNNQLRIRLSDEFGQRLLSADSSAGQPYSSDSAFRAFFKGFSLVPDDAGGGASGNALMSFALSDTNSYLKIYYTYIKNGILDTTSRTWRFPNSSPGGNANRIERDYTGSQLAAHLGRPQGGDSLAFIQTSPGSYTILRMPALDQFKAIKGNVIVHLAEIQMSQIPAPANELNPLFTVPQQMYMDFRDTISGIQTPFLTDAFQTGRFEPRLFGGTAKATTAPNGSPISTYSFFITRYVQQIITRNTANFPIYLYSPYTVVYGSPYNFSLAISPLARGRVKLGGGKHSSAPMRMRIVYSKI
jgi:hypothetical protein